MFARVCIADATAAALALQVGEAMPPVDAATFAEVRCALISSISSRCCGLLPLHLGTLMNSPVCKWQLHASPCVYAAELSLG